MKSYHDIHIQVAKKAGISIGHIILDAGTGLAASLAICLAGLVGKDGLVIAVDYEHRELFITDIFLHGFLFMPLL